MAVDWNAALEAVHDDGRVFPVALRESGYQQPDDNGDYITNPPPECGSSGIWKTDGTAWAQGERAWRVRNVQPKPDDLCVRMEDVARRLAEWHALRDGHMVQATLDAIGKEARAIVELLPKPVDADLIAAREVAASMHGYDGADNCVAGKRDEYVEVMAALAGIRRGRELERSEKGEG